MSTPVLVLGQSGGGKSTSFRNLDPSKTLLIQVIPKPVPFSLKKFPGWTPYDAEKKTGNIFVSHDYLTISALMQKTKRKNIIVDDVQYLMALEFLRRATETGFTKFTEIALHMMHVYEAAAALPEDTRVYFLSHTEVSETGMTKIKTIGKLLDEKITIEGLFSIVLKTVVQDGKYYFATRNNGSDTTKTPMDMFADEMIPNDLALVDKAMTDYGW